jgi:hypothetical protein
MAESLKGAGERRSSMSKILSNQEIAKLYYRAENGDTSFDLGEFAGDGLVMKHVYDADDEAIPVDARLLGGAIPVRNGRLMRVMSDGFVLNPGRIAWGDWGFVMTFIIKGDMCDGAKMDYPIFADYETKNGKITKIDMYQDRQQAEPWYSAYAVMEAKEPLKIGIDAFYAQKLAGAPVTQVEYPLPDGMDAADYDQLVRRNEDVATRFVRAVNGDNSVSFADLVGDQLAVGYVYDDKMESVSAGAFADVIAQREARLKQVMPDYVPDSGRIAWGDWGFAMGRTIKGRLRDGTKIYLPTCGAYTVKNGRITTAEFYQDRQQAEPLNRAYMAIKK